jgi:methylenetetrahydrofolate reductase (NADPH)
VQGVSSWSAFTAWLRRIRHGVDGLLKIGVDAVFCVTGDGRGHDVRPDVTQTFDLDGLRLVSLAASVGIVATVPETPIAR